MHRIWIRGVAALGALVMVSSPAVAQRKPRIATAAQPPSPPAPTYPFFGVTDLRTQNTQRVNVPENRPSRHHDDQRAPVVVYVPVPMYGSYSGGGVYDTSGRPLDSGNVGMVNNVLAGTPDLSGSPYTTIDGGVMVVDFASGVRRSFPACAAQVAEKTPDGQARTVFFQQATAGVILPSGDSGRVRGEPSGAERVCYTADQFGRLVLTY